MKPTIPDHRTAVLAGVLFIGVGSWCLFDAYERRGRSKPFWTKLLPGG